jgi:hypothetical protein
MPRWVAQLTSPSLRNARYSENGQALKIGYHGRIQQAWRHDVQSILLLIISLAIVYVIFWSMKEDEDDGKTSDKTATKKKPRRY